MSGEVCYDSYFDPPESAWGSCPHCGCSQEDAERLFSSEVYVCHCGEQYSDDEAHPDPREMRDECRMRERGL